VHRLLIRTNRIQGVDTTGGTFEADTVVLAGGAWSAELLEPLGQHLEVMPVRGQMLLFRGQPGLVRHIVMAGSHYLIPRRDGRILAGSTVERVGFEKSTTPAARAELQQAALELIPALADCAIEQQWAGLRPGSPAGIPFIGPHPAIRDLYVNAGHFRNGLVLGPASACLLADLMLRRTPALDPAPYSLATH